MQEGQLLNWVRGTWMMDGCPIRWKNTSVGEKYAQSGGEMFLWERETLN
jgi:hypothetical protein